jgi:hypothetical protein
MMSTRAAPLPAPPNARAKVVGGPCLLAAILLANAYWIDVPAGQRGGVTTAACREQRVEHCTSGQLCMGLVVRDGQPPAVWISKPLVWVVSFTRLVSERMP